MNRRITRILRAGAAGLAAAAISAPAVGAAEPICHLESTSFGGVYCLWEEPAPTPTERPPAPPTGQNQPPPRQ